VVEPLYHTQHVGDTILQVAKALQGSVAASFPWPDYEACLKQSLGSKWDALIEEGVWVDDAIDGGFETSSGKMVLMNDSIGAVYMADERCPAGRCGNLSAGSGTLRLHPALQPVYRRSAFYGENRIRPYRSRGNDGFVEINPETAAKLGLADGQSATLTTPVGEARVK
jgi:hypothetical protein